MQNEDNTIKLGQFRAPGAKVFTGRDNGESVRKKSKIDEIASEFDDVHFVFPKDIYSINPSFFEELFTNVVNKLGKDKFLSKFEFHNEGSYDYQKPLNEAIERILRKRSALHP